MEKLACQIAYAGVPQTLREKKYSQQGAEGNTTIPLFLQSENPSYESIKLIGKVVAKILWWIGKHLKISVDITKNFSGRAYV
jgi:hypothetical protein